MSNALRKKKKATHQWNGRVQINATSKAAFDAGYCKGYKDGRSKEIMSALELYMLQMCIRLNQDFHFGTNKEGTGRLDRMVNGFINDCLVINNDVNDFARDAMKRKLKENTGIEIEITDTEFKIGYCGRDGNERGE